MKVNVGHRDYGYRDINCYINANEALQVMIEEDWGNKGAVKIDGNWAHAAAGAVAFWLVVAPHTTHAAGIDLTPISDVTNDGYWTIAKLGVSLASPFLAYGFLALVTSAGDAGKRNKAKVVGLGVGGGLLGIAATPWVVGQSWHLLCRAFHLG